MITIVNYGLGNIHAFVNVYKKLGIILRIATSVSDKKNDKREKIKVSGLL
jgi:hypothetical protein